METVPSAARPVLTCPGAASMALLQAHVPLTLLLDLAWGVSSSEVYEREPADVSWVPAVA